MKITEKTDIRELYKASQEKRDRAKEWYGVGTIRLAETGYSEEIGVLAASFINNIQDVEYEKTNQI